MKQPDIDFELPDYQNKSAIMCWTKNIIALRREDDSDNNLSLLLSSYLPGPASAPWLIGSGAAGSPGRCSCCSGTSVTEGTTCLVTRKPECPTSVQVPSCWSIEDLHQTSAWDLEGSQGSSQWGSSSWNDVIHTRSPSTLVAELELDIIVALRPYCFGGLLPTH
jgi:hypothetical protein